MAFPVRKVRKPADLTGKTNGGLPDHLMKGVAPHGKMHHLAANAWNAMREHAARDGVHLSNVGTYRSYEQQLGLFMQRYVKGDSGDHRRIFRTFQGAKWMLKPKVAPAASPGTSNHGWGLAIDACLYIDGKAVGIGGNPPASRYSSGTQWLMEHCHKYGFSWELQSEPWHIRYVEGDNVPEPVRQWLANNPMEATTIPAPPVIPTTPESPTVRIVRADPPYPGGRGFRIGMKNNPHVKLIQRKLNLKVDGWFGPKTREAVKTFQRLNPACGPVDGWVGQKTWDVMFRVRYPFAGELRIGMKNSYEVRLLQKQLGIFVDGWFGRKTKAAVISFQRANPEVGPADGVVSQKTWDVLFR